MPRININRTGEVSTESSTTHQQPTSTDRVKCIWKAAGASAVAGELTKRTRKKERSRKKEKKSGGGKSSARQTPMPTPVMIFSQATENLSHVVILERPGTRATQRMIYKHNKSEALCCCLTTSRHVTLVARCARASVLVGSMTLSKNSCWVLYRSLSRSLCIISSSFSSSSSGH